VATAVVAFNRETRWSWRRIGASVSQAR
jgi:hypothetical protein